MMSAGGGVGGGGGGGGGGGEEGCCQSHSCRRNDSQGVHGEEQSLKGESGSSSNSTAARGQRSLLKIDVRLFFLNLCTANFCV